MLYSDFSFVFFFNDTATTEIYTLSLHDALPISAARPGQSPAERAAGRLCAGLADRGASGFLRRPDRSEEHTSELQSRLHLVCRLLLEKKKTEALAAPTQTSQEQEGQSALLLQQN